MFCLILKKVSLKDHTVEMKKHIGQLVRVSTEGLVIFNQENIIDCNLGFASLFGYSQTELLGMDLGDLLKGFDKSVALLGRTDKGRGNSRESYELIGIKRAGATVPIEVYDIDVFDQPEDHHRELKRIAIVKDISRSEISFTIGILIKGI